MALLWRAEIGMEQDSVSRNEQELAGLGSVGMELYTVSRNEQDWQI